MSQPVVRAFQPRSVVKDIRLYISDYNATMEVDANVPFCPAGYHWNRNLFLECPPAWPPTLTNPVSQNDDQTNTLDALVELKDINGDVVASARVQSQARLVRTVINPNNPNYTSLVECTSGPYSITYTSQKPRRFYKVKLSGNRGGWGFLNVALFYVDRSFSLYAFT
jgi:hypothetical protein